MTSLAAIRTAIVQTLGTVPAIGRVHDRERYLADEAALRALFLHELPDHALQLRGWWLRRAQTSEHALNAVRGVAIASASLLCGCGTARWREPTSLPVPADLLIPPTRPVLLTPVLSSTTRGTTSGSTRAPAPPTGSVMPR